MNRKLFLTAALPLLLVGCSQDELTSEIVAEQNPGVKTIEGLTLKVNKEVADADTRVAVSFADGTASWDADDKMSLFWLGDDGMVKDGAFITDMTEVTDLASTTSLKGKANAVFRTDTESGDFTSESVVYEGYNLLVYPADLYHVTADKVITVSVKDQKAIDNASDKTVWVSDSVLQIHAPIADAKNVLRDMYKQPCEADAKNTSGYDHGIAVGMKQITSLFKFRFKIEDADANIPVQIKKVILTTTDSESYPIFNETGKIVALDTYGGTESSMKNWPNTKVKYPNVWFAKDANVDCVPSVEVDCEGIVTHQPTDEDPYTEVEMVLLPAYTASLDTKFEKTRQPKLEIVTNYGVVTVGGDVKTGDAQVNCIYDATDTEFAAKDDNAALTYLVENTRSNTFTKKYDAAGKKTYTYNRGVVATRTVRVNMNKAEFSTYSVKNTDELNTLLAIAKKAGKANAWSSTNKLTVKLDFDGEGKFVLENYMGINEFLKAYPTSLTMTGGTCYEEGGKAKALENIVMSLSEETNGILKTIDGLTVKQGVPGMIIPDTSTVRTIDSKITNYIVSNKRGLTVETGADITLTNNDSITIKGGKVTLKGNKYIDLKDGATLTTSELTTNTYGTINYVATSKANLEAAAGNGANYITVNDLVNMGSFFSGGIDVTDKNYPAVGKTGITLVMNNCGNLNETVSNGSSSPLKAEKIILKEGTSYPDLTNAQISDVIVETTNAEIGTEGDCSTEIKSVTIKEGVTATIGSSKIKQLAVYGTATISEGVAAPTDLYAYGAINYNGDAEKVEEGRCIVVGTLNLKKNISYPKVAISETPTITGATLTCSSKLWVYSYKQYEEIGNVTNLTVSTEAGPGIWKGVAGALPTDTEW